MTHFGGELSLRSLKPHMVERSPSGLYTSVFYVLYYCGESFLQKIAARLVSLSSSYFLQKPLPQKGYWGLKWLNE